MDIIIFSLFILALIIGIIIICVHIGGYIAEHLL